MNDTLLTEHMIVLEHKDFMRKFYDDDNFYDCIEQAYKETIPSLFTTKGLEGNHFEKTVDMNSHFFEFDNDGILKYLFAFRSDDGDITMCISILYVHPKYRNQGIGTELVERFKYNINEIMRPKKIVFVTSASPYNHKALDFFYGLDFVSPLEMDAPDDLGAQYVELLWSLHEFNVRRKDRHLLIELK